MVKLYSGDTPAASSPKRVEITVAGELDEDASDEGFTDEIERELVGDDGDGEGFDGVPDDEDEVQLSELEHVRRARGKRPRDEAAGDGPSKRAKPAGAEVASSGDTAGALTHVVATVATIVELVAQLEHTAQVLCQRAEELIVLRKEVEQLRKTAGEQAEQNGELTRVLWAVREEYHKLKDTSAMTEETNSSLQDNLRTLTRDYDTLRKENEAQKGLADACKKLEQGKAQADATADESKKKHDELEGLLLAVREEYHKLKLTYDDKEKKLHTVTQRYDELSQRAKELTRHNQILVEEVKSARAQHELSVPPPDAALAAELDHQKKLCEAVRLNYQTISEALQQSKDSAATLRAQTREVLEREEKLVAERDALLKEKADLARAVESGARQRGRSTLAQANAEAEAARLTRAVCAAEDEARRLAAERQKFVLDWDRLVLQRDKLGAEASAACRERDALRREKDDAVEDKARAEKALAGVLLEKEAVAVGGLGFARTADPEMDHRPENTALLARYTETYASLVREQASCAEAHAALSKERASYTQTYTSLVQENLHLRMKVAELERLSFPPPS
ncbi:hypothetical protein PHLGIDRAFT_119953 [Phlebiopsis gigantea 11061_1 CR5-6]|uniref:Uncharacterized protein n=1 Tax=Phlebiopsis gigantea (strain 11061_1 CR5-6) TaxID=745531 RepID=A0A0C3NK44_PHLG1|nr:hypothetical protein PHLGIDRAFT_119953 [Phlebiopsis gigantea 11061_1 CR5-6]